VLAGRDRERQRCSLPTLPAVENAVATGAPPGSGARLCSEMSESCEQRSRSSASAVKRTPTWGRIAARQHGADVAKALRFTLKSGPQRRVASVSGKGESLTLGSRTIDGCTCRQSVAEVGLKHLLPASSRRAESKPSLGREVARCGSSFLDEGGFIASGKRVRSDCARTDTSTHNHSTRLQGRASNRWKASSGCGCRRAKPTTTVAILGLAGKRFSHGVSQGDSAANAG
jgi:hypothetical protein